MNRKLVYAGIYVCVAFMFPALPLHGLKFLGGILLGVKDSLVDAGIEKLKNPWGWW